jgi:hypothetical protein
MISEEHGFVFLHVSRTAGTSIGKALFGPEYVHRPIPLRELEKWLPMDRYFKFCFLRNPWDKAVSQYFQARKPNNLQDTGRYLEYLSANQLAFSEWIKKITEHMPSKHLEWSGIEMVSDALGNVKADFIGKFERLQDDFDRLCDLLALPRRELDHQNRSVRAAYIEYYDDESRSLVERVYAKDIEHFGYVFGG